MKIDSEKNYFAIKQFLLILINKIGLKMNSRIKTLRYVADP